MSAVSGGEGTVGGWAGWAADLGYFLVRTRHVSFNWLTGWLGFLITLCLLGIVLGGIAFLAARATKYDEYYDPSSVRPMTIDTPEGDPVPEPNIIPPPDETQTQPPAESDADAEEPNQAVIPPDTQDQTQPAPEPEGEEVAPKEKKRAAAPAEEVQPEETPTA